MFCLSSFSDAGIFINKTHKIIIIAYVDDCIFMGKNLKHVKQAKEAFMKMWECWDLGEAKEFLKMKIQHTRKKLILDQHDYLDKIVTWFDLEGSYLSIPLFQLAMSQKKIKEQPLRHFVLSISLLSGPYYMSW